MKVEEENVSWCDLCDLGIQFGSVFSVNIVTAACFQRTHSQAALGLFAVAGRKRDVVSVIRLSNPGSRSTPLNDCN